MYTMQTGTEMTKLKGKKKGLFRFFYLDEHKSCIRWRPSKKQDKAKSESSASLTSGQACVSVCVGGGNHSSHCGPGTRLLHPLAQFCLWMVVLASLKLFTECEKLKWENF